MKWIDACLQSLLASEYPIQIVVVDNASADGTAAYVSQRYPQVQVVANTDNRGFARANNQGMRLALDQGAGSVFLLNQDATVLPGTVGSLVRALDANPMFGVISPVHLNGEGSGLDRNFEQYCLSTAIDRSSFQVSLNPESPQDTSRSVNKLDIAARDRLLLISETRLLIKSLILPPHETRIKSKDGAARLRALMLIQHLKM
jgi:glycosyltransferase involved in cell wall biosynthesis